jgi:chemotaxis methyl-accepting protein methylase/PAS domain-containing protein
VKKPAEDGQSEPVKTQQEETPMGPERISFPIVALGASAGGLEALEQFLSHVPARSGIAFVIIQHLDPTHKGIMPELLQRATPIEVHQAKDRMKVEPDHIYTIPPNKNMSILHGALHLFEPSAPRGLRLPIDYFLRSLAEDHQEKAAGVILSGMGSDGTMGLRAIKEKGGLALAQEPSSAKFDSMPRSVIDQGLIDIVAPAEELPGKIIEYFAHSLVISPGPSLESKAQSALEKIIILLRNHSGQDFSAYKKNTVYRRIERRMSIHQIDKIASYVRFLQENPQELGLLFKELLIGVTSFFRDSYEWKELQERVITVLLTEHKAGNPLRAWVVGCSTGEEAYSLAIALKEVREEAKLEERFPIQIYATDLDRDAIDKARQGSYPDNIVADISPERLARFFVKEERGYRVSKEIREMVVFAEQNVIQDPPFTKLDILTCRNLLIYLTPDVQKMLLPLFHYSLAPGGILFLGNAETIGTFTDLFAPVSNKIRIYRRLDSPTQAGSVMFPVSFAKIRKGASDEPAESRPVVNLQTLTDKLLIEKFSPAAVLTNDKGDILYISTRTGKYLEPAVGKTNWNIFAMAREGLRYELTSAFRKALLQKEEVVFRGLNVRTNGSVQTVDLTVQAIQEPEGLRGMVIIVFTDVAKPKKARKIKGEPAAQDAGVAAVQDELRVTREELQSCREEMQSSQEEAKSTNEELQSTNEELQSTNEELTTSKEELQSMNEELQTVNRELQTRVDSLTRAENDWENLLNSSDIATLFLTNELRVRRFTTQATRIFKLIPGDVNRPITDFATDLYYPEMVEDAKKALKTLVIVEREVTTRDSRWLAVRVMPYRTLDNRIDGVTITFTDISVAKALEAKLRAALPDAKEGKSDEEGQK